jgi:aromatic ring-opening dioxygenase catalytic subunit (LigB family)
MSPNRSPELKRVRMPVFYIPHGGGPCFFMDWKMGSADTWDKMAKWLKMLPASLPRRPSAIVIFSAHWEEAEVTVNAAHSDNLLYDYYGFPEHTYKLEYPAQCAPKLAKKIRDLLDEAKIDNRSIGGRGLDHGVFVPLKLVYPEADVPIVQVSLRAGLSSLEHLKIGAALETLRDDDILIIGSGMSYHNLHEFFGSTKNRPSDFNENKFDDWLTETLCNVAPEQRWQLLAQWEIAPGARAAHPREEHLIPLMVATGASKNDLCSRVYNENIMGHAISGFQFG